VRNIAKYLATYAEHPARQIASTPKVSLLSPQGYQNLVVLPCYAEPANALEQVFGNLTNAQLRYLIRHHSLGVRHPFESGFG